MVVALAIDMSEHSVGLDMFWLIYRRTFVDGDMNLVVVGLQDLKHVAFGSSPGISLEDGSITNMGSKKCSSFERIFLCHRFQNDHSQVLDLE